MWLTKYNLSMPHLNNIVHAHLTNKLEFDLIIWVQVLSLNKHCFSVNPVVEGYTFFSVQKGLPVQTLFLLFSSCFAVDCFDDKAYLLPTFNR